MSPTDLRSIRTFPSLVKYLRDELDWPIETEDFDDLTFDYRPEELGIDPKTAASIEEIKQLRPLVANQPWGIFFIKFEPKRLPVVVLRRILRTLVIKKRASASKSHQATWNLHDLLFISSYGESDHRDITFAHFTEDDQVGDLPALRVLGWDDEDTVLHLEHAHKVLRQKLRWPSDPHQVDEWSEQWSSAFTLRHKEVITTSRDLAIQLARLATAIRKRVSKVLSIETESGPLHRLMKSFKKALIHDLYEEAFADMYAQTITYGLLSARVSRPAGLIADNIADMVPITNPFLRELLSTFLNVGGRKGKIDFDELGINEVVHALRNANMEAVLRDFGDRSPQEDPVIHFYELFLKEYNPELRMQRGVFYTPRPVVSFIVRSVDEILRTEFGLEDGLADITTWGEMLKRFPTMKLPDHTKPEKPFIQILDPALGTGTFLVEVIDIIHKTMTAKWQRERISSGKQVQLWNEYVPRHLLSRLYGFELLMAPYAIAHMKIGLKLWETGYRFGSDERAHIYLTNSLELASDLGQQDLAGIFPALAHEAQAVNAVKRHKCFTVVIGNPPYAGISSNMTEQAQRLVDAYKVIDGEALGERKLWLQDDYVKFIRLAQLIIEQSRTGILGYITNHGYVDNPTFRGMRQSLMGTFQRIRVLDLHGNALKKEHSPDGSEDKNVFDIRQGVAICLAERKTEGLSVQHAHLWGMREAKYSWLATHTLHDAAFESLSPRSPYYLLAPGGSRLEDAYHQWDPLSALLPTYSSGIITARDEMVLDHDPEAVLERIAQLRDSRMTDSQLRKQFFTGKSSPRYAPGDSRGWKLPEARRRLQEDRHWRERLSWCLYRPFDRRSVYLIEWMVDWSRPELRRHLSISDNVLLVFPRNTGAGKPWDHAFVSRVPILGRFFPDSACITYMAPLLLKEDAILGAGSDIVANGRGVLAAGVDLTAPRKGAKTRFAYIYALLHSPTYREQYAEDLRVDFPRLPLTSSLELFRALAELGGELVALHLMESPKLDRHITKFIGERNPEVEKVSYSDETVWIDKSQTTGFKGVPEDVWNFDIGGYQVCEKWLKDRKGRRLTKDDIEHYQKIVTALNETIHLMGEIDKVINQHGGWPNAFSTSNIGGGKN